MTYAFWTAEQKATLQKLWSDGYSAGRIGQLLGITRNAAIGQVHRMRLPKRVNVEKVRAERTPRKKTEPPQGYKKPRKIHPGTIVDHEIPLEQRKNLFELGRGNCRWPVGNPGSPEFYFCGAPTKGICPYCGPHWFRAIDHAYMEKWL